MPVVHVTGSFSLTTSGATADGASVPVETLPVHALLLESQCSVHGTLPPGVHLAFQAVPDAAPLGPQAVGLLVDGGSVPSGTVLTGMLSYLYARL